MFVSLWATRPCVGALTCTLLCLLGPLAPATARAEASVPVADMASAKDTPWLGRFPGAFLLDYNRQSYGELSLPVSPLVPTGKTGARNRRIDIPGKKVDREGRRTRLGYVMPLPVSTLELLHHYQQITARAGGGMLFECKQGSCGDGMTDGEGTTSGSTGLIQIVDPPDERKAADGSNICCTINPDHRDQRCAATKVNAPGRPAYIGCSHAQ
jgi:OmpA-OmpF porin, OOP family